MSNIRFSKLENTIKEKYPKFKIKFKNESALMKTIGNLMFFNKSFMTNYTTTIGQTVYFSDRAKFETNPDAYFETLAHEYVHVFDYAKHPVLFTLKYLFPQLLALPSLLFIAFSVILIPLMIFSIISLWWMLLLCPLIFLAPIPSPGRTEAELRGFGMSLKVRKWENIFSESAFNFYTDAFTTSAYYFMCPNRAHVISELRKYVDTDECLKEECFQDVYNIVK